MNAPRALTDAPALEVVICTYDNARMLDATLASLARQRLTATRRWGVLVVDNNSGSDTAAVIERHLDAGLIPELRVVREERQGLTHARLRGLACTTAEWLAYVDDDCLVDETWVEQAMASTSAHPSCGALGGRVLLRWEAPPHPVAEAYGWCYAAQDHGSSPRAVEFLVGAGLVVRRTALVECGWSTKPLLHDRIGRDLISGGDVEMVLRARAAGYELFYEPALVLHHVVPRERTSIRYLRGMTRSLGTSQALADALAWEGSTPSFVASASARAGRFTGAATRRGANLLLGRGRPEAALLDLRFALGYWQGIAALLALPKTERESVLGRATPARRRRSA
jgi:glycosyltransferase involved in cell wall biosynthesis